MMMFSYSVAGFCRSWLPANGYRIDHKTKINWERQVPIEFEHGERKIGLGRITRTTDGLWFEGSVHLHPKVRSHAEIIDMVEAGQITAFSLACFPFLEGTLEEMERKMEAYKQVPKPRVLKECEITEVSICREGADERARIKTLERWE